MNGLRAAALAATVAISVACVRDSFTSPFSTANPFPAWISDEWRSAYPWAVLVAAAFAFAAHRGGRSFGAGDACLAGLGGLVLARFAGPGLYGAASSLIPADARDDALIPLVWAGLAFETWLPVVVSAFLGLAGLQWAAVRVGGGWPMRGRR